MPFIRTNEAHELAVAVEDRPDAGTFDERRFARGARHCHREQAAFHDGLLDLADDLQVVGRPGEMKRLREVDFAEELEVARRLQPARGFGYRRQVADIAASG